MAEADHGLAAGAKRPSLVLNVTPDSTVQDRPPLFEQDVAALSVPTPLPMEEDGQQALDTLEPSRQWLGDEEDARR